jgi:hypothetical protein
MDEHDWLAERCETNRFAIAHGKIVEIDAISDPECLRQLDLAILGD